MGQEHRLSQDIYTEQPSLWPALVDLQMGDETRPTHKRLWQLFPESHSPHCHYLSLSRGHPTPCQQQWLEVSPEAVASAGRRSRSWGQIMDAKGRVRLCVKVLGDCGCM